MGLGALEVKLIGLMTDMDKREPRCSVYCCKLPQNVNGLKQQPFNYLLPSEV